MVAITAEKPRHVNCKCCLRNLCFQAVQRRAVVTQLVLERICDFAFGRRQAVAQIHCHIRHIDLIEQAISSIEVVVTLKD